MTYDVQLTVGGFMLSGQRRQLYDDSGPIAVNVSFGIDFIVDEIDVVPKASVMAEAERQCRASALAQGYLLSNRRESLGPVDNDGCRMLRVEFDCRALRH